MIDPLGEGWVSEDDGLPPVRGYVTALRVEGGEVWVTLSDGTTIHRREVDGVWEDVE